MEQVTFKDRVLYLSDGTEFKTVSWKGKVPALKLPNGEILTELPIIIQYIADQVRFFFPYFFLKCSLNGYCSVLLQVPELAIVPKSGSMARYRLLELLNFLNSDMHQSFRPLFFDWHEESKEMAKNALQKGFARVSSLLQYHEFLLGKSFGPADAYAYNLLRWSKTLKLGLLEEHESLSKFFEKVENLPVVQNVLTQEGLI